MKVYNEKYYFRINKYLTESLYALLQNGIFPQMKLGRKLCLLVSLIKADCPALSNLTAPEKWRCVCVTE